LTGQVADILRLFITSIAFFDFLRQTKDNMDAKDEVKSRIDIVDLVGESLQLKPAGGGSFKTVCPFHMEKSPSFYVSREKQIWHCFGCFPAGSLIKTESGFVKIEDVKKGDRVLTYQGTFMPVIRTIWRPYDGGMLDIKIRKFSEAVSLTVDHQVFVIKTKKCPHLSRQSRICQWRCDKKYCPQFHKDYRIEKLSASEIQVDDLLLYPVNQKIEDFKLINLEKYYKRSIKIFGPSIGRIPTKIKVNKDFLKLIGYYIAEGSSHRAYIRFSLGNHEEDFALEIKNLVEKIFKIKTTIHRRPIGRKTGLEISACNSKLADIFANLCGKGAENKHIPFEWQNLPSSKQKIILEAIWRGDGCESPVAKTFGRKALSVTTISRTLADQLRDVLLRQKIIPTWTAQAAKTDKVGTHHRQAFTLIWQNDIKLHFADFYQEGKNLFACFPVREIKKREFKGEVFNLTVAKNHSYTTSNFVVGNCGVGGDIFSFIMQMEGVEFPEALRTLAKRVNVEIPRYSSVQTNENDRLVRVNEFAAACYKKILAESPAAEAARDYVGRRGITPDLIEKFGLGFAPEAWDTLVGLLNKKSIPEKDAERAGLLLPRRSGSGYIDRFRNRLMIPLRDVRGQVVAFTGRVMPGAGDDAGPKYLNSPETPIYHKSDLLFGLDLAKRAIKLEKAVIIVEGNLDVVASHKAGIENVVASSGTALTESQLDTLKRLTDTLIFSFDQDAAGFNAAQRGIRLARQRGFQIKVALLSPEAGKDPDEAVQKNPELWRTAVTKTIPVMEYLIERATRGQDLSQVDVKRKIGDTLLPELATIPNGIEREHWLQNVADLLRTDIKVLREAVGSINASPQTNKIATPVKPLSPPIKEKIVKNQISLAAELVFGLFLHVPKLQAEDWPRLRPEIVPDGEIGELYTFLNSGYTYDRFLPASSPSYFEWVLGVAKTMGQPALTPSIIRLGMQGETLANGQPAEQIRKELDAQLKILEGGLRDNRRRAIQAEIRRAEARGDKETVSKLMREFQEIR
jgi:DNA primase